MSIEVVSPLNVLLFSLTHLALLCGFFSRRSGMTRQKTALVLGGGLLLLCAANMLYERESLRSYLYMLVLFGAMDAFACLWSGGAHTAVAQRALCLFLVTDCAALTISHLTIICWNIDVLRASSLPWRYLCMALLFLLCRALLCLLSRLLPRELCADRNSLWLSFLSAVPYLFSSQITIWLPVESGELTLAVPLMVCASCMLSLLLTVSLEGRLSAEREKRQMLAQKHMLELRQQQYAQSKSSAEAVRRKYHDMKNLLIYLEKASREDMRAYIERTLDEVRPYERVLDTGSEAANILLGDKIAVCQKEGIACTVMLDGTLLAFISELDLVTILGNAVDNAIEACRLMPQGAARYIKVRTREMPGFILLHVINSCTGHARMESGRFLTIKADAENHGFGLDSIRRTVESYQGEMACRMEEGEFSLSMIFPRGDESEGDAGARE